LNDGQLFQLRSLFMGCVLFAPFAVFFNIQFIGSCNFVFLAHIVMPFADSADEQYEVPMPFFLSHTSGIIS
jgi:hypothetical protein